MAVLISACGASAPGASGTGGASSNNAAGGAGSSGANAAGSKHDKAVKFAECMRANGYPAFPDPNASGEFNFGISVSAAVWLKALGACRALQPPGSFSGNRSPKQQSTALKFAQCIRQNGVRDFPDPVNGQPLIDTYRIPSANRPGGMTILNAATHKCGSVLQATLAGQK